MRPVTSAEPIANVALVTDTLGRGGAERALIAIANGLRGYPFRVHVITTRAPGDLASGLGEHVVLHSLQRSSRWDLAALPRFARLIDQNGIRLIHVHSHSAAYFVRMARMVSRRKWICVMHDHYGPIRASAVLRCMDALLLRNVDYYFGVSQSLVHYASDRLKLPAGRREHLPNAVDIPTAVNATRGSVFTIAQVARVDPDKGQDMALAVAQRLRAELPSFRWLMIGRTNSPYARRCLALADRMRLGDHVVFTGERHDVMDLLSRAHVGVLTSRHEALPLALLDYMAAQLPVVVTDTGDCGTIVRASGGGDVVAGGDAAGFATALRRLASEPARAQEAGARNRRYVQQHCDGKGMIDRVADTYHALLSGRDPQALACS